MSFKSPSNPGREAEIQPFPYAEAPLAAGGTPHPASWRAGTSQSAPVISAEDKARQAGRQEGEARARELFEQQITQEREAIRLALEDFTGERVQYYQRVETEVVQLALSIARKILHREAQVDPFLLAGMVRVALDKLGSETLVTVRVHPQQAAEWRAFFAKSAGPGAAPEVVEDPAIEPGRCVLQSSLGTTELGVEVQLKEIEHGLLDLLAQRPGAGL